MITLPVNSSGARLFSVNTGTDIFAFRTYYTAGETPLWLMDIYDGDGVELLTGLALVPGSDNLLKGHGDKLEGCQLYVLLLENEQGDMDALGKYLQLIWYNPGEENLVSSGDPLSTIGKD